MADGYIQQEGVVLENREPVLLVITFYNTFFNNVTMQMDYVRFT